MFKPDTAEVTPEHAAVKIGKSVETRTTGSHAMGILKSAVIGAVAGALACALEETKKAVAHIA